MINLKSLVTHSLINNVIIGLVLGDSCKILRENEVIKLKIKGPISKKDFFSHVYNIIRILDEDLIYDFWEEVDKFISFSILDNDLIKYIFHYFYLDERFSVIYTEESLESLEEKKIVTSWNTVIYNSLKNEPQYQNVKKYISKRLAHDMAAINNCSFSYWFLDSGFYDYQREKYFLIPGNFEGTTILNLLKILKKRLGLHFSWNRKKNLLILNKKSEEYLEFYLKEEGFSSKIKNYQYFSKYNEYVIYLIIYLRYLEFKEYRRDLDLE